MISLKDDIKVDVICEDLIGDLRGVGETNMDEKVLRNLEVAKELISRLLWEIICNAEDDRVEFSVQRIVKDSRKFLERIKSDIEFVLKED